MTYGRVSILMLLALLLLSVGPLAAQDTECEEGFRFFENELLAHDPLCIPENPERIVTLNSRDFDLLLATGSEPIGAVGYLESIYERNFPYMVEDTSVTYVGFPANLELVLELEPDLIIASPFGDLENYDQLNAIAPTVIPEALPNVEWETSMRFMGDVLNLSEDVETLLAEYDARVEDIIELIGDPSEIEISVVRYFDDGGDVGLQMQLANAFSTDMLADIGFARPAPQALTAEEAEAEFGAAVAVTLSLEELPLVDGEYLFAWSQAPNAEGDAANEDAYGLLSDDPLWGTLEAVQNAQTFQVGGHWVGWGFPAAHAILDDLFVHVAGVDPAEVSPNPFLIENMEATEEASAELFTDDASLVVLEETEDTRVIQHSFGETEIPRDPQRIITLQDQNALLPLLELGRGDRVVGSIGSTRADGTTFFRRTQDYDTSNITYIGGLRSPNLEVIAELEPDLIVGSQAEITDENYDLLSSIAPTIVIEQFTRSIWGSIFDFALLVNAQDQAIALKASYDARVANIQAELDDPSEITVSVIGPLDGGFFYEADRYIADMTVISDIGLTLTPLRQDVVERGEFGSFSIEEIQLADADALYVYDIAERTAVLVESPLYGSLDAVDRGQAYLVDISRFAGLASQSLNAWLDVFEETLLVDDFDRDIIQEEE
ncbi:MAG: ABC transporter substrate-binding protein [Chloroflexota bacterium]